MDRRSFVDAENRCLGRFLDVECVVGWGRSYLCECGFRCTSPGDIFDHSESCGKTLPGQLNLFATEAR